MRPTALPADIRPRPRRWPLAAASSLFFLTVLAALYLQKDTYTDDLADLSRRLIGDENTARVESWYFRLHDRIDQLQYRLTGGDSDPFARGATVDYIPRPPSRVIVLEAARPVGDPPTGIPLVAVPEPVPPPMERLAMPEIHSLRDNREPGEEQWSTAGLPRNDPEDPIMARTFVRPDPDRPYATVGILLVDARRTRLHIVGGTAEPGSERGVEGPGAIAPEHLGALVAAWNGGFQGPHGSFGMVANELEYKPLRNGFASIAVLEDGTILMGEWGRTLTWRDDMVAVRQNAALLVEDCAISDRTGEGNETWGYVQVDSSEFITWRSAIGLTAEGDLLVAAGNSLSAATLARALWAAGACTAMQLDINNPYVLISLFFAQPDGQLRAERLMAAMPDAPSRFLHEQKRDFMYLTVEAAR